MKVLSFQMLFNYIVCFAKVFITLTQNTLLGMLCSNKCLYVPPGVYLQIIIFALELTDVTGVQVAIGHSYTWVLKQSPVQKSDCLQVLQSKISTDKVVSSQHQCWLVLQGDDVICFLLRKTKHFSIPCLFSFRN